MCIKYKRCGRWTAPFDFAVLKNYFGTGLPALSTTTAAAAAAAIVSAAATTVAPWCLLFSFVYNDRSTIEVTAVHF